MDMEAAITAAVHITKAVIKTTAQAQRVRRMAISVLTIVKHTRKKATAKNIVKNIKQPIKTGKNTNVHNIQFPDNNPQTSGQYILN